MQHGQLISVDPVIVSASDCVQDISFSGLGYGKARGHKLAQCAEWIRGAGVLNFSGEPRSLALPGSKMVKSLGGSFHSVPEARISGRLQAWGSLHLNPHQEFQSFSSNETLVAVITLYHNYFGLTDTQNFCKTFPCSGEITMQRTWKRSSASQMLPTDSFLQVCGSYLLHIGRHVRESVSKKLCKRCSYVVGRKKFSRARLPRSLLAKRHFFQLLMFCSLNPSCLCLERNRPINTRVWLWIQNAVVK